MGVGRRGAKPVGRQTPRIRRLDPTYFLRNYYMPVLIENKRERSWASRNAISLAFIIILLSLTGAQQPVSREYQVKAVFLYNFTQFVEWPEEAFENADDPLVIGVIGNDPFGPFLDETVNGEKLANHPLTVKRYESVEDLGNCHIVFVSVRDRQQLRTIIETLKSKPVLTVGDTDDFTRLGGMIRFFNEGGKIRLRINMTPVDDAHLTISSKLLRLSEIIPSKNK